MPAGVIDIAIVGDPVDPSPLKDKVAIAALISSCVPLVYKPIKYKDCLYADGGLYDNLPLKYFKENRTETLGIYVSTYYSNKNENFKT